MENNILISIITASYNYGEYISDTINSVINENLTFWRLHDKSLTCNDKKDKEYFMNNYYARKNLYKNLPPLTGIKNNIIFNLIEFLRFLKYLLYLIM